MEVRKTDGTHEEFSREKLSKVIRKAYRSAKVPINKAEIDEIIDSLYIYEGILCSSIRQQLELRFKDRDEKVYQAYVSAKREKDTTSCMVKRKKEFIWNYKKSKNNADATVDDNSNVANKNIGVLNAEIHKQDNIETSREMIMDKLAELYPNFNKKNYKRDLESHIIYKHDESSFCGPTAPYCVSITMYPFLTNGIKGLGGLSAAPKNIDSFCGMYTNLIFSISAMYAGAVATSEFLLYFTYFAKKEYGEDFWKHSDRVVTVGTARKQTIMDQLHQYWQHVVYTINQPMGARGLQSAFTNFSYFDKPFFEGMFGDFYFPDGSKPDWESLCWIQKEFMKWFNEERTKTMLTFPVESFTLLYKDGKFQDEDSFKFVCEEYARGHSFFTYISDTVDSLSSCCFSKDTPVLWKSSTLGVQRTNISELYDMNWEPDKKNLRIFHNGSWVPGKPIKLDNRDMFKVTTSNKKEYVMTDNHINITFDGEKQTKDLKVGDYLMFNTTALQAVPENDEGLTYEEGFIVGAFLGDGSFGSRYEDGSIYDTNFSQCSGKYEKCMKMVNAAAEQLGAESRCGISKVYNNVYPLRISSKKIVAFIQKWTNWHEGTNYSNKELNLDCLLQSYDFRKGILDGWYNTDGGNSNRCYTTSVKLKDSMEALITSLGFNSIIDCSDRTDERVVIRGEEYSRNYPLWCVRWYEPCNKRSMKDVYKWKNNSQYFKVTSIEKIEYSEPVYCFEMKNEDEPYFTLPSGLITHNCRLKNKIQTKEFNFTNGNIGIQTGSKSVITLNLSRIIQDWFRSEQKKDENYKFSPDSYPSLKKHIGKILERVYKYHTAYNEWLWDMYDAKLLPAYLAGFIDLNKQYMTIGLNGLNQAAEFLGMECSDNDRYAEFCQNIFGYIKEQNELHKVTEGHKLTFNTEMVPAESLAIKNYNWDKADGYWVPEDTNLYASYIYKPNDPDRDPIEKIKMHGSRYIGDYLDGGSAAHINLDTHLSAAQYRYLLKIAAREGCSYITWNIPNSVCEDCGYISKVPLKKCPHCGSTRISLYDRIIGYLTKILNWSAGRQIEQKTRVYSHFNCKEDDE